MTSTAIATALGIGFRRSSRPYGAGSGTRSLPRRGGLRAAAAIALLAALVPPPPAGAQTLAEVPGTVVYWRDSPFSRFFGSDRVYTTSPSIAVLPDGDYLLSFNLFGSSLNPPASDSGTTYIYRSSDKGASWTNLTPSPMMDMKRGSLFVHDGDAYLWGYRSDSGEPRILKSTDNGTTWSAHVQLDPSTRGGTPMNPVVWTDEGGTPRVWCSIGGRRMMSGRADLDLMNPGNWSAVGRSADIGALPEFPSGSWMVMSEAQIVASPRVGVVVMPKVQFENVSPPYFSYTVLLRRQPGSNNGLQAAGAQDWIALPGADKKFGAGYDPVSERFYVISNPVLPAHYGYSEPWNMIRNTAALMSSADLETWDVQRIFMYGPNVGYEGFQYLNFDYDGDDMVIASRTAFDITGEPGVSYRPPRGHDSNLVTFHRIEGFRTAAPDHYLALGGGVVRRHERTQHAPAPLGDFVMGTSFAGAPLGAVDAMGNFLGAGSAAGITFHSRIDVAQPPPGERGWTLAGDGDWDDLHNWYYWNRADTGRETANFGSAIGADATVTLNRARTVQGLRFRSPHRYTIAGQGALVLATVPEPVPGQPALAEAVEGAHYVDVPVQLGGDAVITAHAGAELRLRGGLDIAGRAVVVGGAGGVRVGEALAVNSGALVLDGLSGLRLATGAAALFSGNLEWRPGGEVVLNHGDTFTLFPNLENATVAGAFDEVLLPELAPGLEWDLTALYTSGTVSVGGESPPDPAAPRVKISHHGGTTLTIDGPAGAVYLIQVSTNLVQWDDRDTVSPPVVPFDWSDPDGPVSGSRFYRVMPAPE